MDLLHTLLETCTTLTKRVEHLQHDKIARTLEITKLKQRVKKLERKNKLKVSKLKRLKRVGTAQRVDISKGTVMDDVSKQGRILANMDKDEDVTLKDVADIAKEVVVDAEIEENADTRELMEEEDIKALKRASESQAKKAVKKQKLDEEVKELKKYLQIVLNDEHNVYTEATTLALKTQVDAAGTKCCYWIKMKEND
nr:hypothetical protein [Tanacetum cinerariifolium]